MATGSGAFPTKAGYNQSGGGYYIVLTTVAGASLNTYTPGTGSGGATTVGSFAAGTATTVPGGVSTLFAQGRLVKDMGKTVVSAGRTFRKIQAVSGANSNDTSSPTFGVTSISASDATYASYYVETGREGANTDNAPTVALARYF